MSRFIICPLIELDKVVAKHQPSHLITLITAGTDVPTPAGIDAENHLYLNFNDIDAPRPGLVPMGQSQMETLVAFFRKWDQTAPMVIHCFAGVSRSTAASMIGLATLQSARPAKEIAADLRFRSPMATPNKRMLALADDVLKPNGSLHDAGIAIGRGADCFQGNVFAMPINEDDDGTL